MQTGCFGCVHSHVPCISWWIGQLLFGTGGWHSPVESEDGGSSFSSPATKLSPRRKEMLSLGDITGQSPRHQDTVSTVRVISSPMSSFPFTEPPPWLCLSKSGCFLTEKAAQLLFGNHFTHCRQHLRKGWGADLAWHCPQSAVTALSKP